MRKRVMEEVVTEVWAGEEVSCDLCGFDEDDTMITKVEVGIGADECVGTHITRDVCQDCYDDKLHALFDPVLVALKAGDRTLLEVHEEDRWHG